MTTKPYRVVVHFTGRTIYTIEAESADKAEEGRRGTVAASTG